MSDNNSPRVATVSQINGYIKKILDNNIILNDIWIKGEISNYKAHYSGHLYITLKDETSVLKAVMFRGAAKNLTFTPSDGMKILARGRISAYEAGGVYQLYIEEMIPEGVGSLYIAYEQLKKRLEAEGLFNPRYKKPIPKYPQTVGVITAPTGAAVRDIINVITRRYPSAHIVLFPSAVQGADAAPSIVKGIKYFNEEYPVDTLIVGRGGGSIEDLWAFNEEIVARAIFESKIPIISAVGHETDFTIADFVADMRAPTPSAAAEISVPSRIELAELVSTYKKRLSSNIQYKLNLNKDRLKGLVIKSPERLIAERRVDVDTRLKYAENAFKMILMKNKNSFSELCGKLDALSPLSVMSRGFAIPVDNDGTVIKSADNMTEGKEFVLKMNDGDVMCRVNESSK